MTWIETETGNLRLDSVSKCPFGCSYGRLCGSKKDCSYYEIHKSKLMVLVAILVTLCFVCCLANQSDMLCDKQEKGNKQALRRPLLRKPHPLHGVAMR